MTKQLAPSKPWHVPDAKGRGNWSTPPALFREIERRHLRGYCTLDPCAEAWNAKSDVWFGPGSPHGVDGLALDWISEDDWARVFVNCPYSDITPWVEKAIAELRAEHCEVIAMLLPARTDQKWFQLLRTVGRIEWIVGRVSFHPPPGVEPSTPFEASIIAVLEHPVEAGEFR